MVQLLSRKNKKGAAFFVRQRLPVLYLVVWLTAICCNKKSALQLHKKPKSAVCPFTYFLSGGVILA
jgi:hypothetical protein